MPNPQPLDYETRTVRDRNQTALRWAKHALRGTLFILLVLLSAGWLVPMFLAVMWLVVSCRQQELGTSGYNSFPHLHFAEQAFTMAFVWLTAVVLTWSIVLIRRVWPASPRR